MNLDTSMQSRNLDSKFSCGAHVALQSCSLYISRSVYSRDLSSAKQVGSSFGETEQCDVGASGGCSLSVVCWKCLVLILCQNHIRTAIKEEEGEQVQKDATSIKQRSLQVKVLRIVESDQHL